MSRLLLKARPTPSQLADRLRPPRPDGLELYLDAEDVADQAALDAVVERVEAAIPGGDFTLLIEGPVRSLDGAFFDLTRQSEADREVIRRLGSLARRLQAEAVNIHAIAPTPDPRALTAEVRRARLRQSLPLVRLFVDEIMAAGAIPAVENMPPILRMRESAFYYSPIGLAAEDLLWLCDQAPGLRTTLDLSHAGLYVNCQRQARAEDPPDAPLDAAPELLAFMQTLPEVTDVLCYAATLGRTLLTCHVANASGLLGEGEPFDRGDLDLWDVVPALAPRTRYFVTETLERDPNQAVEMRRALEAMRKALRAA